MSNGILNVLGNAGGGGSSGVTSIIPGTGISVDQATGDVTVTNTGAGSGTVTHTGNLTANALVLGNGTADTKVVAGITTDGTSVITLGVNTTTIGKVKMFGNTSGDATIQPAAVAGTATVVTLPNASSTLPIFGQQITFTGPTAARSIALPDAAFTVARTDAANTFTGVQSMTSPAITTSITTASTSFTALAGATTLLTFGGTGASASTFFPSTLDTSSSITGAIRTSGGISAAKAANIGTSLTVATSAGIGAAVSASTALNLPASTTSISSLRLAHGSAPTAPVNGDVWTTTSGMFAQINSGTVGPFGAAGGTVTVVSAGSLTSTALVTGGGTTTLQTPSATATMDSSGNISTPGTITVGSGASTAGALAFKQGTTQSTGTTNITIQAPTSVTSYIRTLPGTVGSTGYVKETVAGSVQTESVVTTIPAADVAAGALASGMTATTQAAADNSTKVATTAYVDRAARNQSASVNLGSLTGTINIDWSAGTTFRGVLTGNTVFTFSNGTDGQTIIVDVAQTGTNSFTVTWPSMKWAGGTAPTMTTGSATSDITTIVDFNAVFKGNSVQNVK